METGSWKVEVALGAVVVAVLAAFVWLTFQVGGSAPRNAAHYVLMLDSALGLSEDNAVAVAGVKIGVVDDIVVEGRLARITIAVDPKVELHQNAKAALRQRTLLGEKYVDLDPGAAPSPVLAVGSTLTDNVPTVEIDQVIRDVAVLVDRLNTITPPLESAIARIDTLLQGESGQRIEDQVVQTLADVRVLVKESSKLVQNSGGDVSAVLAMMRQRGPALIDRLDHASTQLDQILSGVDPKIIENATARIAPTAENIDRITVDMRKAAGRLDSVLARLDKQLAKLDQVDEQSVREFFQVQGVRVNLIPDSTVTGRIKRLKEESVPLPE